MTVGGAAALSASEQPLAQVYDVALLDLDGVVYIGSDPVAGAAEALRAARAEGMRLAFVTNNASRTPEMVAKHLTELGIAAQPEEVVTSAQAAAHYLADRLPSGSRVLVLGTVGLYEALGERGLVPVSKDDDDVAAVVQGYSPTLDWHQLAEGAMAIHRRVPWVATNLDPTVPSPRGPLPGNGSLVAALRYATGAQPVAVGKPQPTMHQESVQRSGAHRPIVIGDRLDTDIEGADAVGCASLLVLTGVTSVAELIGAVRHQRPTYLAEDLGGLLQPHPATQYRDRTAICGAWSVTTRGGELVLHHDGQQPIDDEHPLDAVRALCVAAWQRHDSAPEGSLSRDSPTIVGGDDTVREMLLQMELLSS
jgi:glycerol 3-phosphatase-2